MLTCVFFFNGGSFPWGGIGSGSEIGGSVGTGRMSRGCGGCGRADMNDEVDDPAMVVPSRYRVWLCSIRPSLEVCMAFSSAFTCVLKERRDILEG